MAAIGPLIAGYEVSVIALITLITTIIPPQQQADIYSREPKPISELHTVLSTVKYGLLSSYTNMFVNKLGAKC